MHHRPQPPQPSLYDDYFVRQLVPPDHPLLVIDREVDFSFVRELVGELYCPDNGREARDPELLLRLCFLQSYCGLSDREVIDRAQTDLAFRLFLHLGLEDSLPHPSLLTVFRRRLGPERFQAIFNRSVTVAVERGLVKGRLVMVDSYGIVADLAIPRLRRLLMRLVRKALSMLSRFGAEASALMEEQAALLADESWWQSKELREKDVAAWFVLTQRVREAMAEAELPARAERFRACWLKLLDQVLQRQTKPKANERGDRLVSDVDPDARWSTRERGKKAMVGYKQQIAIDPEHEIITGALTTPANVDDTQPFEKLLDQHEANTQQRPEAAVADSGYSSGENRHALAERGMTDYVAPPTPKGHKQGKLSASDFEPEFDDEGVPQRVRCPAGHVAEGGRWKAEEQGWHFYFTKGQCEGCALRERCSKSKRGRTVFVSAYHREHADARARKDTPEFTAAQVARLEIERTFAYQQRRASHDRARFRGLDRVAIQVYLGCFMVNLVRIVRSTQPKREPRRRRR
ncbi:MAG: IS1182 family transposase [Armatimonadetes bacterium]|nr:IS1182 family transposase [Armatimonadota bacterium]